MHPILFYLGKHPIGTYGVAIVLGMFGALWLCGRLARRCGLSVDFFFDLIFVLLFSGFLGARLLYIIQNWKEFAAEPFGVLLSRQGFVFQGGFVAALAAGVYYTLRRRMPLLTVADIIAPALALAHAFGRVGCFFAGCCYGKVCPPGQASALERMLSVRYPLHLDHGQPSDFNFAYFGQMNAGLIPPDAAGPLPILPVQLFESLGNVLVCLVLLWAWRRRRFSGQVFVLYLFLYSALRFGLEFLRGDLERGIYFGLPIGQLIALGTFTAGVALWLTLRNKGLEPMPAAAMDAVPNADGGTKKEEKPRRRTEKQRSRKEN